MLTTAPAIRQFFTAAQNTHGICGPAVKLLLKQYGLEGRKIDGSGPKKNLLKSDVLKIVDAEKLKAVVIPAPAPAKIDVKAATKKTDDVGKNTRSLRHHTDIPLTNSRSTIAKPLTGSKAVSSISVCWTGEGVPRLGSIDISIAVATPTGLITPIIKNADHDGVLPISSKVKELTGLAKESKLKLNQFQGGSFTMRRLLHGYPMPTTVFLRMIHRPAIIYSVDLLIERATGYLAEDDSAQASEKSFQASKLALKNFVKRLEEENNIEIVPKHTENLWSYHKFSKLTRLVAKKVNDDLARDIVAGWETGFKLHTVGWTQNGLTVEEVTFLMPFVLRLIKIVQTELPVDLQMAAYIRDNLFNLNIETIASDIYEESGRGKITQLLHTLRMRKDQVTILNEIYKTNYGEDLADVLLKNKSELKRYLGAML